VPFRSEVMANYAAWLEAKECEGSVVDFVGF